MRCLLPHIWTGYSCHFSLNSAQNNNLLEILVSAVDKCNAELVHVPEDNALVLDLEVKQLMAH